MTDLPCRSALLACICLILLWPVHGCIHMNKTDSVALQKSSRHYMAAGDYQRAMDLHHSAFLKAPNDPAAKAGYIKILEEIGVVAARTYEKEEYGKAGRIYHVLLVNHPAFNLIQKKPSFERKFLLSRISSCSSALSKQGLELYRGGNLQQAIAVWEGILSFDPDNAEIRKMLLTADAQMKSLDAQK